MHVLRLILSNRKPIRQTLQMAKTPVSTVKNATRKRPPDASHQESHIFKALELRYSSANAEIGGWDDGNQGFGAGRTAAHRYRSENPFHAAASRAHPQGRGRRFG